MLGQTGVTDTAGVGAAVGVRSPQQVVVGASQVVIIENADSLVGKVINGEQTRELVGNVRIRQDNVRLSCDRAVEYQKSDRIVLTGNVVVIDDSVTMRAPRGVYHKDERRAEAFDDVRLEDGTLQLTALYGEYFIGPRIAFFRSRVTVRDTGSTLTADSLTYYRDERRSIARGRATVYNRAENVTILGNHVEHLAVQQFSRVTQRPVLMQLETGEGGRIDTLIVRCRVMEAYRDSAKRLRAIDSVEIVRSELAARAGLAEFFTEGDSILLRRSPVVWYENTQVIGDSINVYLDHRTLRLVHVMGSALAVSQADSLRPERFDQVTGETMKMHFVSKVLDHIDVEKQATSIYHLYEDTTPNGLNKTSGDRILLSFDRGRINAIKILGGVEGQYYPENLVNGHESEFALPDFLWRTDRPQITAGWQSIQAKLTNK